MARHHTNRKPTFLWRGILIVLPVAILAAVGIFSLRQDRLLAQQDAHDRARQLADTLLADLAESLAALHASALASAQTDPTVAFETAGAIAFRVSSAGRLLEPPPLADPFPKPLDDAGLDSELGHLWRTARTAEFRDRAADIALRAYREFLDREPPDGFAASARISLAILEAQRNRHFEAGDQLRAVIQNHPATPLESGLPASVVASLKLIDLAKPNLRQAEIPWADLLDLAGSNAVRHPTWVSRPLLDAAVELADALDLPQLRRWQTLWLRQDAARRLFNDARHQLPSRDPGWVLSHGVAWLALSESDDPADRWIVCLPERVVGDEIDTVLRGMRSIPSYFGLAIGVASRQYRVGFTPDLPAGEWGPALAMAATAPNAATNRVPAHQPPVSLASRAVVRPAFGDLVMDIFLDDPQLLFARQRTRTFWFGALIVVAASAALVGLVTTWRAFHRQQLLADMQSRFVASVSHELRAPIGSIRLLAEGLESGRVRAPDKQTEYFGLMGQECRRLTALIENVLDFSRIDQGRKQYEFEPTDILALVRQTVRLMEPQATDRHVTLTLNLPSQALNIEHPTSNGEQRTADVDLPHLDGRAIQQALVNLIDNAIKHAPPNSAVEIGLLIGPSAQPPVPDPSPDAHSHQPGLQIRVADCGDGIPPAEQEKIFEPFYRRGTELRRETPGIGIGLSIVKHIVEAHGGRVTVESEPGHGSRFTLHLP